MARSKPVLSHAGTAIMAVSTPCNSVPQEALSKHNMKLASRIDAKCADVSLQASDATSPEGCMLYASSSQGYPVGLNDSIAKVAAAGPAASIRLGWQLALRRQTAAC